MNGGITRDTFKEMPPENRELLMFDLIADIHRRTKCLEKRVILDTVYSTAGGALGGFLAIWTWVKVFFVKE